jgi:hypothetical protein
MRIGIVVERHFAPQTNPGLCQPSRTLKGKKMKGPSRQTLAAKSKMRHHARERKGILDHFLPSEIV